MNFHFGLPISRSSLRHILFNGFASLCLLGSGLLGQRRFRTSGGRIIQMVLLQVQLNFAPLLGRVGAPRATEFLIPSVHLLVVSHATAIFRRVVAGVAEKAFPFGGHPSLGIIFIYDVDLHAVVRSLENEFFLKTMQWINVFVNG